MDKKTVGLIATIGTFFLCACPSIFLCVWGGIGVAQVPIDKTFNGQTVNEPMSMGVGVVLLCLSLIGLLTPVVVGFFTLRKKPEDTAINAAPMSDLGIESDPFKNDEPLPPTS
jgi:hypothetical protein